MEYATVMGVDVAHWNPRTQLGLRPRRLFAWTKHTPLGSRVNNFGDLLGPVIVQQLAELLSHPAKRGARPVLGAVGSIVHMLPTGAVVWGAGVNGKHTDLPPPSGMDIRAVRGPLTQRYLNDRGYRVPQIYGDPALLIDYTRYGAALSDRTREGVLCIPNLNDAAALTPSAEAQGVRTMSPVEPLERIVRAISGAELVVGSSLHAIIVAEALGVPARAVRSRAEPRFKYEDYYEGTGRAGIRTALTIEEAVDIGGVAESPHIDSDLERSFPHDLWTSRST